LSLVVVVVEPMAAVVVLVEFWLLALFFLLLRIQFQLGPAEIQTPMEATLRLEALLQQVAVVALAMALGKTVDLEAEDSPVAAPV
jgi:hypothetical protein